MVEVSAENITLVTVVTFLSVFFLLTASMPSGLIANPQQGKEVNVPTYFEAIEIQKYAQTYSVNLTSDQYTDNFDLGGWRFEWWSDAFTDLGSPPSFIVLTRYDSWWIFYWYAETGRWYEKAKGTEVDGYGQIALSTRTCYYITKETLDTYYDAENHVAKFTIQFAVTQFDIFFAFNTSAYSKPSEAWNNNDLHALIGINFDKTNTTFNAWNLIGAILFFQMPDINPALNALIAIPIWILIAWLIYILILKAIPFVGG
jgi:hypothetical protein